MRLPDQGSTRLHAAQHFALKSALWHATIVASLHVSALVSTQAAGAGLGAGLGLGGGGGAPQACSLPQHVAQQFALNVSVH